MNAGSKAFAGEIVDPGDTARITRVLLDNRALSPEAHRELLNSGSGRSRIGLRQIWEASDISAHDLADEIAAHYRLPRLSLPQLLSATGLVGRFAPRFLREAAIFPFEESHSFHLAMADPGDQSARRAAEIELGTPVKIAVVSFEDIATALSERLGDDSNRPATPSDGNVSVADESVDSLRDLASGAPVVRAVDDLIEKAVDMRASDIHIEPMRNACASTDCCDLFLCLRRSQPKL